MLSNKLPALARAVLRAVPVRAQVVRAPEQVLQVLERVPQVLAQQPVRVLPPQVLQLQRV